jgi:3-hydroxybutyryl-CoA dehydrogenase
MLQKKLFIWGDEQRKQDFLFREMPATFRVEFLGSDLNFTEMPSAAAYFILDEALIPGFPFDKLDIDIPVFICCVVETLQELPVGYHFIRLNAWPGFLRYPMLEISSQQNHHSKAEKLLHELNWPFQWVADVPGLVTPRVISMIVNEACFALDENISTPAEIDIAMQLGTSYPQGPFAWGRQIGSDRIIRLLTRLAGQDDRYLMSPGIENYLNKKG